jgi:hypothetical protein
MFFLALGQESSWWDSGTYHDSGQYGIDNPTEADIHRVVEAIAMGEQDLAILMPSADPDSYMQTAGGARGGFVLEYQEGSLDQHFQAVDTNITADRVVAALVSYLRGESAWKAQFTWAKMKF